MARLSKLLCTTITNPNHLQQLLASRLIPLDKCPGIRPIGVGEVLRRIIRKTIMCTLKQDVCNSVGKLQTCGGQQAGVEAAIHAMHNVYSEDNCEAILLVDATNAFNSLNREVASRNVKILCPYIAKYLENTYSQPSRLYVAGGHGDFIYSQEGTTQGDNRAMG